MRLATTTADLDRYINGAGKDLAATKKMLDYFAQTSFKYLDYSFYADLTPDYLLLQDNWQDSIKAIRDHGHSLGLEFVQSHSAGGNPLAHDDKFEVLLLSTIRSIEACGIMGIKNIVVHSGHVVDLNQEEIFARKLSFYERLFPTMEKHGVNVLIENSATANLPGNHVFFDTGQSMRDFLAYANHPLLGACWDTGHANMMPTGQYGNLTDLGEHLKAVHIADNLGTQDNHFAPYFGSSNMDEIITALLDINYPGYFTFESTRLMIQGENWPVPRKKWARDNRLYEVPLELKLEAEKLLYKIGEYMLTKYDCLEL